jgi:hypothetical protein
MLLTSILVALQLLHDCHSVPADTTTGLDLSSRRDILVKRSLVLAEAASHGGFSKDLAGGAKIEKTAGMSTVFFFFHQSVIFESGLRFEDIGTGGHLMPLLNQFRWIML